MDFELEETIIESWSPSIHEYRASKHHKSASHLSGKSISTSISHRHTIHTHQPHTHAHIDTPHIHSAYVTDKRLTVIVSLVYACKLRLMAFACPCRPSESQCDDVSRNNDRRPVCVRLVEFMCKDDGIATVIMKVESSCVLLVAIDTVIHSRHTWHLHEVTITLDASIIAIDRHRVWQVDSDGIGYRRLADGRGRRVVAGVTDGVIGCVHGRAVAMQEGVIVVGGVERGWEVELGGIVKGHRGSCELVGVWEISGKKTLVAMQTDARTRERDFNKTTFILLSKEYKVLNSKEILSNPYQQKYNSLSHPLLKRSSDLYWPYTSNKFPSLSLGSLFLVFMSDPLTILIHNTNNDSLKSLKVPIPDIYSTFGVECAYFVNHNSKSVDINKERTSEKKAVPKKKILQQKRDTHQKNISNALTLCIELSSIQQVFSTFNDKPNRCWLTVDL